MNFDCSFIIVNYRTKELTKDAIDSIFKYTVGITFEIIVVDNCSSDGSTKYLRQAFGKQITVIEASQNKGFGSANNLGAALAKGKYLFLLNSDAYLLDNAAKTFLDYAEMNKNVAVCGAQLLSKNKAKVATYGNFPSVIEQLFRLGPRFLFRNYFDEKLRTAIADAGTENIEVDYVSGAAFFISTKIYQENKGFDEEFFLYYEETEFCYRLKAKGYKLVILPTVEIVHLMGASSLFNSFNFAKYAMIEDSRKLFYKKCYGSFTLSISNMLEATNTLVYDILNKRNFKNTILKVKKIISI